MNIKETLKNYKRVLTIASKPSREEFLDVSRICAIGMAIVGAIGFVLYLIGIITGM